MAESNEARVWGIHSQDEELFLNKSKIAICCGGEKLGDLSKIEATRDAFRRHYVEVYPHENKRAQSNRIGELYRFIYDIQVGDYIVFPTHDHLVHIGRVCGQYKYVKSAEQTELKYVEQRDVKWLVHLPRTEFSLGALRSLGSMLTIFQIKPYADEYKAVLD